MISGVLSSEETIELGRQGENKATQLEFVLTDIKAKYGMGTPVLVHKRPGDDRPHIVQTTFDSASCKLTWIVLDSETLNSGTGQAEIRWLVNDSRVTDLLAKSVVFNTTITSSLMDETTEVPGSIVYLSGTSADWTSRLEGVETAGKSLVLSSTYSNPLVAEVDSTSFAYSGRKGYRYTFKLTAISLGSGSTVNLTVKLKNGTSVVGTIAVTASGTEFSVVASGDFTSGEIIPNVDVNSMSYEFYQTAPIAEKITSAENEVAQLKQNLGVLSNLQTTAKNNLVAAINEVKSSGGSGTGWTTTEINLLETIFNNLAYSSQSAGQTAASSLITTLRSHASSGGSSSGGSTDSGGSSSGGGTSGGSTVSVSVSGSTMTIAGFTATSVSKSGSTLTIS